MGKYVPTALTFTVIKAAASETRTHTYISRSKIPRLLAGEFYYSGHFTIETGV